MSTTEGKLLKVVDYSEVFKFYEAGKDRRYNLLFAVNGGVLAICAALTGLNKDLGALTLEKIAIGMVLFTAFMGIDIWVFASRMRGQGGIALQKKGISEDGTEGIFSWIGKGVLLAICALMITAWLLVAYGSPTAATPATVDQG